MHNIVKNRINQILPWIPTTSRSRSRSRGRSRLLVGGTTTNQSRVMMMRKNEEGEGINPLSSPKKNNSIIDAAAAEGESTVVRIPSSSSRPNQNPNPPAVDKLQQVVHSHSSGERDSGWDKCWVEGLTPWDLGHPTPVIAHLHRTGSLPKGRALVPGCGTGYDVVAIADPERQVTGLDISETAIKKASQLFSSLPKAQYFTFLKEDFFTWHPSELFDLIVDYTFFCAVEPDMRSAWARKIQDILKPDGELITLMFPIGDHIGGPPYKVSISDYEEVLHPMGFKATSILDNELAVPPRKGREKIGRWKRSVRTSSL